jgi:hypothetical protein
MDNEWLADACPKDVSKIKEPFLFQMTMHKVYAL